jgi:multidrug efflux pump subunit AcrA (membrane-fusion protein)
VIRTILFPRVILPTVLALTAAPALAPASPTIAHMGSASVTVSIAPDPPIVGSNVVTVQISSASASALTNTTVRYDTTMPSMNMGGPSGAFSRVAGRLDEWTSTVNFGMASRWLLRVQLAGGVSGSVVVNTEVGQVPVAKPVSNAANMNASLPSASMTAMNMGDDATAWRTATFALIGVIIIGAVALSRNRRPLTIVLVVGAGVVVVVLAFAQSHFGSSSMDMASMQSASGSAPVPVTLARVGGDTNTAMIQAPANVLPYLVQNIVSRAPGLLTDFTVYTGDRLSAGEVVAYLDEPELQSNAQAAQSAAQAAQDNIIMSHHDAMIAQATLAAKQQQLMYWKAEIAREKSLLDQGAVSVQEYQNEKAQAAAAQSDYDAARAKLGGANVGIQAAQAQAAQAASSAQAQSVTAGYTNVVVPDDSIVMKRLVDPGVYVQPGTPILQVAVVRRLRVQAQVAQQDLAGVQIGTPIDITFPHGKVLRSRISSISPVVDPNTHTAIAEAIISNPGNRYQPGGFVHVILHAERASRSNVFSVPTGAIVDGATTAVWTDVNDAAHRVPVIVVSDDGTTAQVTGDLRRGTRVVVTGAQNLEEGQPIAETRRDRAN